MSDFNMMVNLSSSDLEIIKNIPTKSNADFAKTIMHYLLENNVLSESDVAGLTSKQFCLKAFRSSFAIFLEKDLRQDDTQTIMFGQKRYYSDEYLIHGKKYYLTSQWYKPGGTHPDTRTPFYEWFLKKLNAKIGTFDSWEIVNEFTAIKTCDKSFFQYSGSGVPREICWFFDADNMNPNGELKYKAFFEGKECSIRITADSTGRRRIWISWPDKRTEQEVLQYTVEQGKKFSFEKRDGTFYLKFVGGKDVMKSSIKDSIEKIKSYIASEGFTYNDGMIENFWLSLKSKPFVLLAGTSGTGKTRLVRLFAKAIGAEYKLVAVRTIWGSSLPRKNSVMWPPSLYAEVQTMSIIEELWHGNINPQENSIENTVEMRQLMEYISRHRKALEETMNDEQKETFENYIDCRNEYESLYQAAVFTYAFKLGAKLTAAALE